MYHWLEEQTNWGGWTSGGRFFTSVLVTILGLAIVFYYLKRPKSELPGTWAQALLGSVGAFALFFLGYGVVPSEFIIWANSYWELGDKNWLIISSAKNMPLLGIDWPLNIPYFVLEDTLVVLIYGIAFGLNLYIFAAWQKRGTTPADAAGKAPKRRSRFGRPLKMTGA